MFNKKIYFDKVRASLFSGNLTQQQVDGQEDILLVWDMLKATDLRRLAYMLATAYHETSQQMWPIEEYGKGSGQPYGAIDPETQQAYYGRGYVQLTWKENYQRGTDELELTGEDDLVQHPSKALDPIIAAKIMYLGMHEGWFRSDDKGPETLPRYFSKTVEDPYEAREIINGDKHIYPSWDTHRTIGYLICTYYDKFLDAVVAAYQQPKRKRKVRR